MAAERKRHSPLHGQPNPRRRVVARSLLSSMSEPAVVDTDPDGLLHALGGELRSAREYLGLSRAELVERLGFTIQGQTLATYEQGTRQCTVARFVQICAALRVSAPAVLGLAMQKARVDLRSLSIHVDIRAIVDDPPDDIPHLGVWARNMLAAMNGTSPAEVRLQPVEIALLAVSCGLTHEDMAVRLARFAPEIPDYSDP